MKAYEKLTDVQQRKVKLRAEALVRLEEKREALDEQEEALLQDAAGQLGVKATANLHKFLRKLGGDG